MKIFLRNENNKPVFELDKRLFITTEFPYDPDEVYILEDAMRLMSMLKMQQPLVLSYNELKSQNGDLKHSLREAKNVTLK